MHPKYAALFTSVNLLLGVGPLILPMPFFNAGLGLSIIWMVFICLLSYNSAMYISESMNKLHQIQHEKKSVITNDSQSVVEEQSLMESQQEEKNSSNQYGHAKQFGILFGEKWKYFPSLAITIYLLGTSISKCIMTANTLSKVFSDANSPKIFSEYDFWLLIFFIAGAIFSFKSIDETKIMQAIIIGARVVTIILFFGGAVVLCFSQGIKKLTPPNKGLFNFENFIQIFSNSVFSLMFHHSLPNIVGKLKNTEDVQFVIRNAFLISGSVLLLIPLTGAMAFGDQLGIGNKLVYYNFDFESKIPFIFWITSFYVFLNIAAFSVYIIVVRTNILNIIMPRVNPKLFNKQTLISSIIILIFILLMSLLLKQEIQLVLDFTGGIFGIFILFIIPAAEVYKSRNLMHRQGNPKNYLPKLPIMIGCLGVIFMGFNLYNIIEKL